MTSMFGGRGAEDRPIAPAFAPGEVDGVRRVMTLCGAWLRRLRSPAFRPESFCIGGGRSAARRRRDCSDGPDSHGCASAARPEIASALFGVCRLNRAVVPTLVGLTLLAGVAAQAYAQTQTLPTVSFGSRAPAPWHLDENISRTASIAINLKLDKASPSDFTVNYTISGTATPNPHSALRPPFTVTPGSDFFIHKFILGEVKVPAGKTGSWSSKGRIWMDIVDDSVHEDSETVLLTLVGGEGYQVGSPSTYTVIIVDNDPRPTKAVSFASASQSAGEGSGTRDVEVRLNPAPTTDIALTYTVRGTATSGSDFTIASSGTLSVPKGAATATIPVTIIDDTEGEGDETVVLTLNAGSGYGVANPGMHTLTIAANDTPPVVSFATESHTAFEGAGTHDVEVRLKPVPTSDITLAYTVGGTATSGSDFTIASSGTLSVPKGAATATIPVTIIDDTEGEGSETVVLTLSGGTGYSVTGSTHTLTIADNEPTVFFVDGSQTVGEGSGTHDVEVRLWPAPTSDITLTYTVGGTATTGSDFTIASSGTLSVPRGTTTATIPVTIIDDSVKEDNETVVLTLSDGASYTVGGRTHTLTIAASDPPGVSFATGSHTAFEGAGTHDVGVTLNPAPLSDITLAYTVGGTAASGSDFTIASSGTLSVPRGAATATIPVTIIDDSVKEDSETVVLTLIDGAGYSVDGSTHTLTIADNEGPSAVSFASGTYRANEGDDLEPELLLSHPRTEDVTVMVETLDLGGARSGEDFAAGPFRVTVPAGKARHRFSIETFVDDEVEQAEEVLLHISPYGHSPGVYRSSSGTPDAVAVIRDDARISLPKSRYTVTEGGTATIGVTIENPKPTAFTLDYTLSGDLDPALPGDTASGADVVGGFGTRSVTVAANARRVNISVETVQDTLQDEGIESFSVRLSMSSAPDTVFGRRVATVSVKDDDSPEAVVQFASASSSADEGAGTHHVTMTLSPAPTEDVNVFVTDRRLSSRTATPGSDYEALPLGGVGVMVPAGERTVTVPVTLIDDGSSEGDETVGLRIASVEGARIGSPSEHTLTIVDDDVGVSFATASQSASEGSGTRNVTVNLSPAPPSAITVNYTVGGTATAGSDYTIANSGTLSVSGGATTATIPVSIVDDGVEDTGETVVLTLVGGEDYLVGNPKVHTLHIDPMPEVTFARRVRVADEGAGTIDVRVNLSPAPASVLTLDYDVDAVFSTATPDADYTALSGTLSVQAGSRSATIPVTLIDDTHEDSRETVILKLRDGAGYRVGGYPQGYSSHTLVILNHDQDGLEGLVQAQIDAAATNGDTSAANLWRRALAAVRGEAPPSGLAPLTEAEARAQADAETAGGNTALAALWTDIAHIVGAATPPTPAVPEVAIAAGADAAEGGDATFTVTATPAPTSSLTVGVTVTEAGGYATAGTHQVTIPPGGSATLTIATVGDAVDEPHGTVTATLAAGADYTVSATAGAATVAVADDDAPPATPTVDPALIAEVQGHIAHFTARSHGAGIRDWGLILDRLEGRTGGMSDAAIAAWLARSRLHGWQDGIVTLPKVQAALEAVPEPEPEQPPVTLPAVTVAAGASPVTEGGDATFTLTANPTPTADLAVSVTVAAAGDYGIAGESRTVTLPPTGSVTLTLATTDDTTDEPDGAVTVTVTDGDGYTVGAPASGTVTIEDDDLPPPEVSIAADAASITEGAPAAFTLSADRAPDADLTITLSVSEAVDGDHVAADDEGARTVTIAKGATEAAFSVATVNDTTDEPDGAVTVTLNDGAGYTVSPSQGAATVAVSDDDTSAGPVLSVADATVREGEGLMWFTVRLSAPSQRAVKVSYRTRESTPVSAQANVDYLASSWGIDFRAGETEKQVWVYIYNDNHDEGAETFEVVLRSASGAPIGDGVGVGTIVNDDPMPAAWLGRFGRTVAEQALDGISGRMAASRTPGMQGTLAGQALTFDAPAHDDAGPGHAPGGNGFGAAAPGGTDSLALADIARGFDGHGAVGDTGRLGDAGVGHGPESGPGQAFGETQSHTMTAREALLGSSFSLTGATDGSGGSMAFWGRGSQARFDGREGTFSLDGETTTAMLGADYARGEWLIGLALAQSTGEGEYRDTEVAPRPASQTCPEGMDAATRALCNGAVREGDGEVEASLTAAIPYASLQASERLKLWGAAGIGSGEVTLKTAMDGSYSSDTTWRMAAAGLRGDLLAPLAEGSGPALALTSDALWARTASEKTHDLAASASDATRLRLGLEGSYRFALDGGGTPGTGSGASLTPKLELGMRHDGGDAETGFGIELGGGLAWSDPRLGLSLDLSGRTLLSHDDDALENRGYAASLGFDPDPATERGPSFALRQEFGARASGGLDALFAPDPLDERPGGEATSRWTAEAAYGFPAFGGRFTASPHVGLGLSAAARDYNLGWRWTPAANAPDLSFGLGATRRESDAAAPEHTVGFEVRARW